MTPCAPICTDLICAPINYEPSLFVNREAELQTVAQKLRQLQLKRPVAGTIINFWGGKGMGKTWILEHLRHLYRYRAGSDPAEGAERPTFAILATFRDDEPTVALERVTRELAEDALAQLSPALSRDEREQLAQARDEGCGAKLVSVLRALSQRFVPLLLLDNAEKIRQAGWELVERMLIEPLVSADSALVFLTSRRGALRWRRFEVRRRVVEPENSLVGPFDKQTVGRQLERHRHQLPLEIIFPYTAGSPRLVRAIVEYICPGNGRGMVREGKFEFHQQLMLPMLRVFEAQLIEGISPALLRILDAIWPLRSYRMEAVRFMLTTGQSGAEQQPEGYYLEILRAFDRETEIVWWDRERRAYVTSPVVRRLIDRRQLLENPQEYVVCHQHAYEMYWRWVVEFPQLSEDFILELWFHLVSLHVAQEKVDALRDRAAEICHFAHLHLNSDRLRSLSERLANDLEICDLLPEKVRDKLTNIFEQLLCGAHRRF